MDAKIKKSLKMSAVAVAVSMGLAGCLGGGGGGSSAAAPAVAGVVAGGDFIKDAAITVCGSAGGCATGTSNASGGYSVDVTGLTAPYIIRATFDLGTGPKSLYSVATGAGTSNVTPATTLATVVALANDGLDIGTISFSASTAGLANVSSADVTTAVTTVYTNYFLPIAQSLGVTLSAADIMTGTITPGTSPIDQVISQVNVVVSGGTVAMTMGGTTMIPATSTSSSATLTTALNTNSATSATVATGFPLWNETGLVGSSGLVTWLQSVFQQGSTAQGANGASFASSVSCAGTGVSTLFNPCNTTSGTVASNLTISGTSATGSTVTLTSLAASSVTASAMSGTSSYITGRNVSLLWTKGSTTGRIGLNVEKASPSSTTWQIKGFQTL